MIKVSRKTWNTAKARIYPDTKQLSARKPLSALKGITCTCTQWCSVGAQWAWCSPEQGAVATQWQSAGSRAIADPPLQQSAPVSQGNIMALENVPPPLRLAQRQNPSHFWINLFLYQKKRKGEKARVALPITLVFRNNTSADGEVEIPVEMWWQRSVMCWGYA